MSYTAWFPYVLLFLFSLWMLLLFSFTLLYCLMRCVYIDNEGRMVIYCYNEDKWRQYATDALIVKEVKDHSQLRDEMCIEPTTASSRRNLVSSLSRRRLSSMSSSGQASSDFQHCVICQEAFVVGEEVSWSKILLTCNHAYHPACIREWLMRNAGCPCCRSSFIHPNDLKMYFCFGAKLAKARWMERKNQIIERRVQGEFCVEHGLIFPPEESGVCSDEVIDGEHAENSHHGDVPMEVGDIETPVPNADAGTGRGTDDEGLTNFEPGHSRSTTRSTRECNSR